MLINLSCDQDDNPTGVLGSDVTTTFYCLDMTSSLVGNDEEIDYEEDFEHGSGGWESNGWVIFDNILPQNWLIQVVNKQNKEATTVETKDGIAEFEVSVGSTIVVAATTPYTTELASYHIATD